MNQCQCCGNEYPLNEMADWTICFSCIREEQSRMGYVYTDSLGIGWTYNDLQEIGGIAEVENLINSNKV